jgi:hypothetical protein
VSALIEERDMTEFKVGDKATHARYGAGEVTYGPLASRDNLYVVRLADGSERVVHAGNLTPAPAFKVGDKVVYRLFDGAFTVHSGPFPYSDGDEGAFYVIEKPSGEFRAVPSGSLTRYDAPDAPGYDTDAGRYCFHEGVTYDLSAEYVDCDDDVWRFPEGAGTNGEIPRMVMGDDSGRTGTLRSVVRAYGPLTQR